MDTIINTIVSNYLADYLEINPEKTKTSILSGTVELSGVKFKKSLFTTLNIPYLELEEGYIGKIHVTLSLPRFYLYPIVVYVDQIYIKVRPKNVNKITEKDIIDTFEIYKQKKLKEFEELMNIKFSVLFQDDKKKNTNTSYTIVESIINNLHINIGKIVFIFDDCVSSPKYPCTFGLTLEKLSIDSTSKDFTEIKEEDKNSPLKYKKLTIKNLNFFCDKIQKENITEEANGDITAKHIIKDGVINKLTDNEKNYLKDSLDFYLYCESEIDSYSKDEKYHNYLIRELNFEIKLIINEKMESKEPLINAVLETSTIYTQITNRQMKAITNHLNYISLKDFYQQTTIDNYYNSKEKIDDKTIKLYLENYSDYYKTKYIEIYKNDVENKKYLEAMQKIEKNIKLDNIKVLREMANDIINNIIEISKLDKEIKENDSSWSFFRSKNTNEIKKLKEDKQKKKEEQKQIQLKNSTLNKFKEFVSGMFDNKSDEEKKKEDKTQFIFKFIMKEFILIIKEEKRKEQEINKIFELKFDLLEVDILIKTLSQFIQLSLRDMEIIQYLSNNKNYKKILFSKNKNNDNNLNVLNNIINDDKQKEQSLILIEFVNDLLLPVSPFKFKLHFGKQIYLIFDYYYINYLYNLFLKHIAALDINNLTSMINEKITKVIQKGYINLLEIEQKKEEENNNAKLFNINIDIILNAPILLLPLYFRDEENTELMYVSFGQLKIKSELAGEKDKNAIYDKYIVELSNIMIKTLKKFNCEENIGDEGEKLIYPASFNIDVQNYIYQKPKLEHKLQKDFSPILINISMNNTKFGLSEDQIVFIIKYLENYQRTEFEFKKEEAIKQKLRLKKNKNKLEQLKKEKKVKKEKEENKEINKDKENIENEKKEENKKEEKKEISNSIKIFIKLGVLQIFLMKNLQKGEEVKKINFLLLFFRESTVNFTMQTNGSMSMDIAFGHFYLYDKDYSIDENNNQIPYINPEFKCIVGTTAHGIKDKKNNKIKFSEIYDFKNEPNIKESLKVLFSLDSEKKVTTVSIFMSKLTISPNFSTMVRIILFSNKYIKLYNDSMEKLKYEILRDKIEDIKYKEDKLNRIRTNDSFAPPPFNIKLDENIKEKQKKKDEEDIIKEKVMKSKEYSVVNVLFTMKGIDIYIPLQPSSHNTSIIFMTVEIPLKYTMETDVEVEFSLTKTLKINYNIKSNELLIELNKGNFSIYEYKDDVILLNSINQICDDIDFSFLMKNSINKEEKCNKCHISVQMNKEMDISININHIIVFLELFDKINGFFNDLNKEEEIKVKEKEIKFIDDEDEIKRARTLDLIDKKRKKDEKKKVIKDENKKINTFNFIDIFTYDIRITNISVKFYDIIDGIYQSLFELYIKNTTIEMCQNSNPKDCTNLMTYLITTFTHERKELNTYQKDNFYLYFNLITNIEIKCLNNYLNQWEYFVEPFSLKFYYCQFLERMLPNIELFIPNMLNFNLSLNFAKIVAFTLKKFNMNKEEIEKNKAGKLFKDEIIPEANYLGIESPILILENYTGVDMEIWFDNMKYEENNELIIKIENNKKFELTNSLLKKYNVTKENNNLNSTISYKFCINNIENNKNNIIGNYFNINYHHIDIHDINDSVKISIECCSDNLLCRHILFNSLISIRNYTKFADMQLCNNEQKVDLKDNKKQTVPISWFIENNNKNITLSHNNDSHVLIKDISQINDINKYIQFNNNDIVIIDVIRYKINLEEYYANKNINNKKDIFRVDIILSPPINLINNTPYDFYVNINDKIASTKNLNIYNNNLNLMGKYVQILNDKSKKKNNNEKEIVMKIIKDINLQIKYENILLTAVSLVDEKSEKNEDDKNEEGKTVNNFSSYNKNLSILLKDNETKTFLICRLFYNNPYEFISYNSKIYKTMKAELNSFKYEIVFDCYFVNRTNQDLYINNKTLDNITNKNTNILIQSNKYTPMSKALLNNKVKLRANNKNWSDKFEISAIGEEFTLNIQKDNINYYSFAIKIRISNLFKKSIALIIEDKYIIMNDLPFDINLKESNSAIVTKIKSNENKVLIINDESLKNKNSYRVGVNKCYSHLFDIDKLGTYDLLISYNQQVFEEENIDVEDKLIELNNVKYYPVRCVINTIRKNTICIIFSYNKQYINQFNNHTPYNIQIILNKDKQQKYLVKPEKTIPLIYFNDKGRYEPFEKVKIIFEDKTSEIVTLNEISTKYTGKEKNYVIRIQPDKNNSIKCIKVYKKNDMRLQNENYIKNLIKKYTKVSGSKIKLFLYGIGFSIINEHPREIFYLSLYEIYLCYKFSNVQNILNEFNNYNSLLFSMKNFQLDYCLDNAYDIVFNPTNQLLPPKIDEKEKKEKNFIDKVLEDEENNTPFIQFVISQRIRQIQVNDKTKLVYSLYPEIAIFIQEFDIRINTILINSLIKVINEYMEIFLPSVDDNDNSELKEIKDNNNENQNIINDIHLVIDNNKNESIAKYKDKLLNKEGNVTNLVINYLTLSAIKVNTTFKVNKNAIEIRYVPELIITLINTLCSTLSSFSDVTLKLNEISFSNIFSDFDSLSGKLMTYYKNQILAQIYKIILNIDLLGNPINLLEGLGTGLFQLFNEPRKGLLKGPEEFGLGMARGARALISNVVGGGFNSVSKITGTLLNATKNLSSIGTEEEIIVKEEEKPKGFVSGALSGLKKGFGELTHGVAGIVTKPIEQSQKGGVGGFFKGLGSGLVGAVLAPVNTVLTVGNQVTSGISNSEFISNKKRLRRFRLPRTMYKYLPIMPYDEKKEYERKKKREEIEGSNSIIISLSNEKLYFENSTEIAMCKKLADSSNVIVTNVMIKILNNECTKFIRKIYVCDVKEVKNVDKNCIELIMKDEKKFKFDFKEEKNKASFIDGLNKYIK